MLSSPDTALVDFMGALDGFGRDDVILADALGWMFDSAPDYCPPRWSLDLTTPEMRDRIDMDLLTISCGGRL